MVEFSIQFNLNLDGGILGMQFCLIGSKLLQLKTWGTLKKWMKD